MNGLKKAARFTRLDRALNVRDHVIAWLPGNSRAELTGDAANTFALRVQRAEVGQYMFMYRTPFSGSMPPLKFESLHHAALFQSSGAENLPYSLDVWERYSKDGHQRIRKLMNLEWGHNGEARLVGFHSGDWDEALVNSMT